MKFSPELEKWRVIKQGDRYASPPDTQSHGLFEIKYQSFTLLVLASDGQGRIPWEHVSVSLAKRCPNWKEMCFVKDLFWSPDETVVQFHPRASEYVNLMPHCLHLWKRVGQEYELPPTLLV